VTEIRSYRRVWDLERRIYRVEGLRLNPSGIPVRGVCYLIVAVVAVVAVVLARRAPVLGDVLGAMPWYAVYVAFPVVVATGLGAVAIEGRPFHVAALGLLRFRAGRLATTAHEPRPWSPGEVHVLVDGSGPRLRAVRYDGPGAVAIGVGYELAERRSRIPARGVRTLVELTELHGPQTDVGRELLWLAPGARLLVRAGERLARSA
jgi:hypothetical protein